MEHVAAFMLLVGCNADATTCQEIPVPVAAYESADECQRDLDVQIRLSGAGQERVYGACKEIDEEAFEQSATIDWSISRSGKLVITFDAEPQVVARALSASSGPFDFGLAKILRLAWNLPPADGSKSGTI